MDSALVDQTSEQYLGQWRRLVSTTNWEKGQIIHQWRQALVDSDAPGSEFTDEAWSRRVGNVTPQHVGRLRRVFERFGETRDGYDGLFWSHFQAALDWEDAEMWLEGAVQNDWSISEMRHKRWEVNGGMPGAESEAEPTAVSETAEAPWDDDAESADTASEVVGGALDRVRSPGDNETDEEEDEPGYDRSQFNDEHASDEHESVPANEPIRPFANLPPLPADVNDAFEAYKLCILRHKIGEWQEISREDMLTSLEALKQLVLAPAET